MEYKIRKAAIGDLRIIQGLNEKLCIKEYKEFDNTIISNYSLTEEGKRGFEKCITSETSVTFVTENKRKIIGYITGGIKEAEDYRDIKYICDLGSMWVDEEYRGKGIGKEFFKKFEKWCKDKKVFRLQVTASTQNEKGINFYKREGFEDYDIVLEKDLN
ncbi:MAG: GNAT family N-acetyltransferase [Candidatus Pacebacteria bacterium]|nr:GNAT family N-acetyltransferase [Candidatus Paceibacterota bacterium]